MKQSPEYDAIVVGSGAGGGIAAFILATSGLRVLLLEAGRHYDPLRETPMFQLPKDAPLRGAGGSDKPFGFYDATVDGQAVHLSPKAYGVLRLLWESKGRALTRAQILEQVWGYEVYPTTRTVDNHIAELRNRLEADPAQPRHILTVHRVGYRFVE